MSKKILLAIPTAKYICVETFQSMWNLWIPDDCTVEFRYSFGYRVDQVRNLVASWAKDFDYLFFVDSDIVLPQDTLTKMLSHDVDVVSGVYIQRHGKKEIPEIYEAHPDGSVLQMPIQKLQEPRLLEVAGCGMGCVLIKSSVIQSVGHPQFEYHPALDHRHTLSEDIDFCLKVRNKGFRIYADTSIVCPHIGQTTYFPTYQ